jgi:dienelactone hydrolase
MRNAFVTVAILTAFGWLSAVVSAQEFCPPDRQSPGDAMIQEYLTREASRIDSGLLEGVKSQEDWEKQLPRYREEYLYMLGLWPLPPKTPLEATVTGTLQRDGYVVDRIHYQSRPHLYVTGNLYRPAQVKPGERLPAVFYVCGHSNEGSNGNKTAYQSHGIWFAKHGYLCLTVDTLQLGEIAAIHHGTYREGRWWWYSRGYTPAGVECLNGLRGIDYLVNRPDVDPERIAVTGASGGGAATYWIAAADPRVKVAVPVSGMADLESYVGNRVINGHCDCMFLHNAFQWPWTRIAALIAPRPMLFTNSDQDAIFPMDANQRVINRLERIYSLYGASDLVDAMVSIGGHAYRKDLRQAAYRFINIHLKNDPRIVADSEVDLVVKSGNAKHYPIEPQQLRVFPTDAELPKDELNTTIDQHFVPMAQVAPPGQGEFEAWKKKLTEELRRVSFRCFPDRIPAAKQIEEAGPRRVRLETEPGIRVDVQQLASPEAREPTRVLLDVRDPSAAEGEPKWMDLARVAQAGDVAYQVTPRGLDETRWTRKNPPNYVERCHVLLGRTVDTGRVWDVAAAARYLHAKYEGKVSVVVMGKRAGGMLAAYAALWEPEIAGAIVDQPPLDPMAPDAPVILNVLRVCEPGDLLGLLAPRPLSVVGHKPEALAKVTAIYAAAQSAERLSILPQ